MKKFIPIFIFSLILSGCSLFPTQKPETLESKIESSDKVCEKAWDESIFNDTKVYTNEKYGYSFKYPAETDFDRTANYSYISSENPCAVKENWIFYPEQFFFEITPYSETGFADQLNESCGNMPDGGQPMMISGVRGFSYVDGGTYDKLACFQRGHFSYRIRHKDKLGEKIFNSLEFTQSDYINNYKFECKYQYSHPDWRCYHGYNFDQIMVPPDFDGVGFGDLDQFSKVDGKIIYGINTSLQILGKEEENQLKDGKWIEYESLNKQFCSENGNCPNIKSWEYVNNNGIRYLKILATDSNESIDKSVPTKILYYSTFIGNKIYTISTSEGPFGYADFTGQKMVDEKLMDQIVATFVPK